MSDPRPRWGFNPYTSVSMERVYQDRKYPGRAAHDDAHQWSGLSLILSREVGEAMQEIGKLQWPDDFPDEPRMHVLGLARSELIQVAAVAVAMIERIDREVDSE